MKIQMQIKNIKDLEKLVHFSKFYDSNYMFFRMKTTLGEEENEKEVLNELFNQIKDKDNISQDEINEKYEKIYISSWKKTLHQYFKVEYGDEFLDMPFSHKLKDDKIEIYLNDTLVTSKDDIKDVVMNYTSKNNDDFDLLGE